MNEQDYILFEAYLTESLSKEELASFEERLLNDKDFKSAFELYKQVNGFLEQAYSKDAQEFKSNLETISSDYFNSTSSQKGKVVSLWKYAIAASVVIIFGLFMFNNFSNPTYGDFADYGEINLTIRSIQGDVIKDAEDAFNSKDFTKADKLFTELLEADSNNTEIQYYKAIANIELSNYNTADTLLENLSKGQSVYKHDALWYLALSKLKQEKNDECLNILKTIPEESEVYDKAQKLVKKLD